MGFLNNIYAECRCRVCKKTFCCKDCRRKHEKETHCLLPDCDICINGKIAISRARISSELIAHLQEHHWPLHCVLCNKMFTTIDDLENHGSKCTAESNPVLKDTLTKTPKFESPPVVLGSKNSNSINMAVTSTPMNPEMKLFHAVPEQITPVDTERLQTDSNPVSANTTPAECTNENTSSKNKRRVTFMSTPAVENIRRKPKNHENFLKASLKNSLRANESLQPNNENSETNEKSSNYASAMEQLPSKSEEFENGANEMKALSTIIIKKRRSVSMSETLWESAINETFALQDISTETEVAIVKYHSVSLDSSVQMQYTTHSERVDECSIQDASAACIASAQKTGVWSSMTSLFKNVLHGFTTNQSTELLGNSLKRHRSAPDYQDAEERRKLKRIKLCDVRCRPPIRINSRKIVLTADKSVQTDNIDFGS